MSTLFPYLVVTIAGGSVMALELVGSRLLSPYFGGTTVIWTALIGIIMACLAAGYWWGGQLADRNPSYRVLGTILVAAGAYIAVLAVGKEAALQAISTSFGDIRVGACFAATLLFGPPSFLLASVGPYVIRMQIDDVASSGRTIGRLNAASTGGSIVGTFLAGFVLLAVVGHFKILIGLSGLLLALAAACWTSRPAAGAGAAALVLALSLGAATTLPAPMPLGALVDVDSHYARLHVVDYEEAGRPVRAVFTDIYGAQAAVYLDGDPEIVFEIQRRFRLIDHFADDAERVLLLGGGIGVVARDIAARRPSATIDSVEIDPAFAQLGREFFGVKPDPRIRVHHEDARTFVRRSEGPYDAIALDAFATAGSVPYQLTTVEFVSSLYELLGEEGVVVLNLASAIRGDRALFLHAEAATYAAVFDEILLFRVHPEVPDDEPQSLTLVALKQPAGAPPARLQSNDPELDSYLARRIATKLPNAEPLRDDFAPVDYYFARAVY